MIDINSLYTRTVGGEMIEMDIEFEDLQTLSVTENPSQGMEDIFEEEKPKHHAETLVHTSPLVEEYSSSSSKVYTDFVFDIISYCYNANKTIKLEDLQHYIGVYIPNLTYLNQNILEGNCEYNDDITDIVEKYITKDEFDNIYVLVFFSAVRALISILNSDKRSVNTDKFRVDIDDDDGKIKKPNVNGNTETERFTHTFMFTKSNLNKNITTFIEDIPLVFSKHYQFSEFIDRIITAVTYSPLTTLDETITNCKSYLQLNDTKIPNQLRVVFESFSTVYTSIFCYYLQLFEFVQE